PALPEDGDLRTLLLGDGPWPGLAPFTAGNFLSEWPGVEPRRLAARDPHAAAAELLEGTGLADRVIEGATLDRWPAAQRGYVRTRTGRALAAWKRDDEGRITLYATRHVYRDQAGHLLPLAMVASEWILERVFRPAAEVSWAAGTLRVEGDVVRKGARLVAYVEDEDGRRKSLVSAQIEKDGAMTVPLEARPDGVVVVGRRGNLPWISVSRLAAHAGSRSSAPAGPPEPVPATRTGPLPRSAPAPGTPERTPTRPADAPDDETPTVAPPTAPLPRRP
ncbi:MAG: hypothetical protein D6705_00870, partial [Deltaproteobacteria bacterium]